MLFEDNVAPEFDTLRQLFDFCDPPGHGNFASKEDFRFALDLLNKYREAGPLEVDRAWRDLEGACNGFVGFAKVAAWAQRVGVSLPIGVDMEPAVDSNRLSCSFVFPDGRRCNCKSFCPTEQAGGSASSSSLPSTDCSDAPEPGAVPGPQRKLSQSLQFCTCGHKRSMHAERSSNEGGDGGLPSAMAVAPAYWPTDFGPAAKVPLLDETVRLRFQYLLDRTHKSTDNWTRDRGCALHGLTCHAKDPMCAFRNKNEVPSGYRVAGVVRNMNRELWGYYALNRGAITKECQSNLGQPFKAITGVETNGLLLEDRPDVDSCNEWFLFHGSSPENCEKILHSNFRLSLAGCGATWKEDGAKSGTPLYGHGIYFADRITKADEYSDMVEAGRRFAGCHTVLVSRVLGGRAQYCDTNEIDTACLQKQVISGPFHSVFGDRVTKLKKPYREVVVYDATQVYPEYLIYYRRLYS